VHEDALTLVDTGVRTAVRMVRDASRSRRTTCALSELCVAASAGTPTRPRARSAIRSSARSSTRSSTPAARHVQRDRRVDRRRASARAPCGKPAGGRSDRRRRARPRAQRPRIRRQHPRAESRPAEQGRRLSTIEEKALGRHRQGRPPAIRDVLAPTQRAAQPGST
jgi:hypothetical protein